MADTTSAPQEVRHFSVINMSDEVLASTADVEALCVATAAVFSGWYGLEEIDGDFEMPLFAFGGIDEWFQKQFGATFGEVANRVSRARLAAALEAYRFPDGYEQTSLTEIVGRAHKIAKSLRDTDGRAAE